MLLDFKEIAIFGRNCNSIALIRKIYQLSAKNLSTISFNTNHSTKSCHTFANVCIKEPQLDLIVPVISETTKLKHTKKQKLNWTLVKCDRQLITCLAHFWCKQIIKLPPFCGLIKYLWFFNYILNFSISLNSFTWQVKY